MTLAPDAMTLELFIERWSKPGGGYAYPWSVWRNGKQVHHGEQHDDPEESEREGMHFCQHILETAPDRITRL